MYHILKHIGHLPIVVQHSTILGDKYTVYYKFGGLANPKKNPC